jgi:hypothetical protein
MLGLSFPRPVLGNGFPKIAGKLNPEKCWETDSQINGLRGKNKIEKIVIV